MLQFLKAFKKLFWKMKNMKIGYNEVYFEFDIENKVNFS